MYEDILGETEKTDEELFEEFPHECWCSLHCIKILNELVEMGIMKMSDDGEPPFILTEKGNNLIDKYWKEHLKREPTEEDINLGMAILKKEGLF